MPCIHATSICISFLSILLVPVQKRGEREFSNEFLLFCWKNDHKQNVKLENQTFISEFKKGVKLMKTKEKHYVYL